MSELEDILSFLESSTNKVKLFFLKETSRRGRNYPLLYRAPIDPALAEEFRNMAMEQVKKLIKSAEIISYSDYGDVSGSDQQRVVKIDVDEVHHLAEIIEELTSSDLEAIDKEKIKRVLGYIVKVQNNRKSLLLFKKYPTTISLKKRLAIFDEGTLKREKNPYFLAATDFDAAGLLAEDPPQVPFLILDFSGFESLFSFKEHYKDTIQQEQQKIDSFVEDSGSFVGCLT
jgi:hypothetical protein